MSEWELKRARLVGLARVGKYGRRIKADESVSVIITIDPLGALKCNFPPFEEDMID